MINTVWKPNRPFVALFFFRQRRRVIAVIILNLLFNGASESAVLFGLSSETPWHARRECCLISIVLGYLGGKFYGNLLSYRI